MMRRFGGSSGMGWRGAGSGGASGGGGGLFRTVSRVARAGMGNLQDPSSSSSSSSSSPRRGSKRGLTLSNTTTAIAPSLVSLSSSVQGFGPYRPLTSSDDSDWVDVNDEFSIQDGNDSFDDRIFGSVPSSHEVTTALLSLQQVVPTSYDSDVDWIEPSWNMYGYDQRINPGIGRVYDALHLLQTDTSVQRMVISLSSDRSVWEAVMNNEAVQELRGAFYQGEEDDSEGSDGESEPVSVSSNVVAWIFNNMRSKFMGFLSGMANLMKEAFELEEHEQQSSQVDFPDALREKVGAAFMLTAIVLLIVVITRASHG